MLKEGSSRQTAQLEYLVSEEEVESAIVYYVESEAESRSIGMLYRPTSVCIHLAIRD